MPKPPPPGVYVPAVIFFDEKEELDFTSIKTHVLRLAKVCYIDDRWMVVHKNRVLIGSTRAT